MEEKKNILTNNNCNLSEEKMSLGATQTVPSRELKYLDLRLSEISKRIYACIIYR